MEETNQCGPDEAQLPKCVLVIDDDPQVRLATRLYLEHLGISVLDESHCSTALSLLETPNHGVNVVLIDWSMPRMNAADFATAAGELEPTLSVVVMSGFDAVQLPGVHQRLGGPLFLKKPFSLAQLKMAMAAGLSQVSSQPTRREEGNSSQEREEQAAKT